MALSPPDLVESIRTHFVSPNRCASAPIADVLRVLQHREPEWAWISRPVLRVLIENNFSWLVSDERSSTVSWKCWPTASRRGPNRECDLSRLVCPARATHLIGSRSPLLAAEASSQIKRTMYRIEDGI